MEKPITNIDYVISRLRNPYGLSYEQMRSIRLQAADIIEKLLNNNLSKPKINEKETE